VLRAHGNLGAGRPEVDAVREVEVEAGWFICASRSTGVPPVAAALLQVLARFVLQDAERERTEARGLPRGCV